MKNNGFYNSIAYKERQSEIVRKNWQIGIYDFLRKKEKRQCAREGCSNIFEVQKSDKKKFCSHSCFAKINNLNRSNITLDMKDKIDRLYKSGLSMMDISKKTGWKYGRVVYCMKRFDILRRGISEAVYQKLNPKGDPFCIKEKLTTEDRKLLGLGLGLYWGEGNKASDHSVRLGNSDPKLIRLFREFLIKICGIKREKLRYSLLLFNDANKKDAVNFWNEQLNLTPSQIKSITSLKPRGKGTYKKKSMTGVLMIEFCNTKLKKEIDRMVEML